MKARVLLLVISFLTPFTSAQSVNHELSESIANFAKSEGLPSSRCEELANKLAVWQSGKRKKALDVDRIQLDKCEATQRVLDTGNGKINLQNNPPASQPTITTSYTFNDGKLLEINIDFPVSISFDKVVSLLTNHYDTAPSAVSTRQAQNAFGARWDLGVASWSLPNNVDCLIYEDVDLYGRYTHMVVHYHQKAEPKKNLTF